MKRRLTYLIQFRILTLARMLSDNIQYKMTKPLGLKLVDGSEKQILNGSYTKRELDAIVGRKHIQI